MSEVFVGIDLGGTNIKVGFFDGEMNLLGKGAVPTNADMGVEAVVGSMVELSRELLEERGCSLDDVAAVGLGSPGPAQYKKGIIEAAANMPKLKNVPIRDMLSEAMGSKPVTLANDANTACLGEFVAGAGKGVEDMVFFTLGTGIGGGIVNHGKLLDGAGDNAAELGHLIIYPDGRKCNCGQRGCVEAYASAGSTARRAQEAVETGEESVLGKVLETHGEITCKDVYEALANGDALAKEVTDGTAKALAVMCVNVLHTTEPARIVFAGGMIAAGDALLERIRYYFDELVWGLREETVEICYATVGEDAGIIGAAVAAQQIR